MNTETNTTAADVCRLDCAACSRRVCTGAKALAREAGEKGTGDGAARPTPAGRLLDALDQIAAQPDYDPEIGISLGQLADAYGFCLETARRAVLQYERLYGAPAQAVPS
jgi:hypothetical protein